jgi:hypothetical protein
MTVNDNNKRESLFHTPKPTELKEQAKKDPIQERYSDREEDINEESNSAESYFEDEQTRALSSSPIVNANLSGS